MDKLKGLERPLEQYQGQILKIIEFIEEHFRFLLTNQENQSNTRH
jgi:hypothetical protein